MIRRTRRIATASSVFFAVALGLVAATPAAAVARPDDGALRELIERIARGDEVESAAACERLIERVVGPLAEAMGNLEAYSPQEQLRLRRALARVSAGLRIRVLRATLSAEDRGPFDRFFERNDDLVYELFDEYAEVRQAAVRRIPLDRGSGAGVLVAAKVDDANENVAAAALEVAAELADDDVARGLARFVRDATAAVRMGFYKPSEQETVDALALFVSQAITVLGKARARASAPDVIAAFEFFAPTGRWSREQVADALVALGRLGDERAALTLLTRVPDPVVQHAQRRFGARDATQTLGDVALLALIDLYGLDRSAFGFVTTPDAPRFAGFFDDPARRQAHRAFRAWYEENARKPREQRRPPTPVAPVPIAAPAAPEATPEAPDATPAQPDAPTPATQPGGRGGMLSP